MTERPKFYLDYSTTVEQLNFGKWIFLQTWIDFLNEKADRIILAKLLSIKILGNYTFASSLTTDLQFQARNIFRTILFPYFSLQSNSKAQSQANFLFVVRLLILFFSVSFTFVIGFYYPVIDHIFGGKWNDTIGIIIPLSLCSFFGVLLNSVEPIFLARRKPKIFFVATTAKVVLFLPLLVFLVFYYRYEGVVVFLYSMSFWQLSLFIFIVIKYELVCKTIITKEIVIPIVLLFSFCLIEGYLYQRVMLWLEPTMILNSIVMVNSLIIFKLVLKFNKRNS